MEQTTRHFQQKNVCANVQGAARCYVSEGREGHDARDVRDSAMGRTVKKYDDGTRKRREDS